MNKTTLAWAACLVFSLVSGMPVQAQTATPPAPAVYTQQQLDQMLAPVALYPDSLLAQVLMASTYPLEVVQAQRFVEARPGLQGDGLARAVAPMPWDPSVKALVQFPSVLAMMNDRLDWMQQLGQAFLGQQPAVMDTVQNLRERARIAGTLESSPQQRVVVQDEVIEILPVNPQVVYVPYYNPTVVYGSWWWPSAPPVVWAPPPRYRPPSYEPGFSASISFGTGIGVMSAVFGDARPDWRQRQVLVTQTRINNVTNVTNVNNTNVINNRIVNNNVTINRNATMSQRPVVWHHDARYAGGRYAQQPAPALAPPPGQRPLSPPQAQSLAQTQQGRGAQAQPLPANAAHPLPVTDNAQQRVIQQDQLRQRQAIDQQRQREQQANDQLRQREQMIRDQQHQRDQQAQAQRQQQQGQERQWQQHQQQVQQQMQQRQREEQMRQQQQQQHESQRQQQMLNHQREQQHQAAQREQQGRQQQAQQREAHQRREDRRDERRDEHS